MECGWKWDCERPELGLEIGVGLGVTLVLGIGLGTEFGLDSEYVTWT